MKKQLREHTRSSTAQHAPQEWILMALRSLTLKIPPVWLKAHPADIAPLRKRPITWAQPPGYSWQGHPTPEVCVALAGESILTLQNRFHHFSPPCMAVIDSGVPHSEARISRTRGYAILWIGAAKSSIHLHVSRYDSKRGWDIPWRHTLNDESAIALSRAFGHLEPGDARESGALYPELIALLASVHRDLVVHGLSISAGDQKIAMLNHVKDYLDSNLERTVSIKEVAAMIKLSPNYLNTQFHEWRGKGIHAYLIDKRMTKAMHLCRQSTMAVKEIAAAVGFADALYFSRAFHQYHGIWPSKLRQGEFRK